MKMFTLLEIMMIVAIIALLAALTVPGLFRNARMNRLTWAINVAEGTHAGSVAKRTDAAITSRYLLVKLGSDADHIAVCGADELPHGLCDDEAAAAEDWVNVNLLGVRDRTLLGVASENLAADADLFTAANGKVQNEPAVAGTYFKVGRALAAAAADGLVEIEPCKPIKLVVIAALTSTNGVAAAASASLANLAAEAEKIGDDVRAIGAALATPALVKVLAA